MSIIQERIFDVKNLKEQIINHPMSAKIIEEEYRITIIYPEGMYPNGARISLQMGKIKAYTRIIEVLEKHWYENGINHNVRS